MVRSMGKPYVSCSWNALSPGSSDAFSPRAFPTAVSNITVPDWSVRRKVSSSASAACETRDHASSMSG